MLTQLIVFAIFGGFGLMLLIVGGKQFIEQQRLLANAQPVEAEIIFSEVKTQRSSDTDSRPLRDNSTVSHYPEVRFRYEVNGASYESDRLRPTIIARAYASREAAAAELAAFSLGARVTAMVNPALPDKAFLIAEKSAGPLVFLILGVVLPPAAWVIGGLI